VTSERAIELHEVTRQFGRLTAVEGLTLDVDRGEVMGLLGPNGSGKTTTVNMISGLLRPTSGTIRVLGRDITLHARDVRRRLGTVPQETALYDELSAEANLRFHADLFGIERRAVAARIDAALELVSLSDRRRDRVGDYSGGMKRRLALARALLHDPDLLYLDEPTLGVDVQSRRAVWDRILQLRRDGRTVLLSTNYLEEASALCDRIAIIDHGRLVALDTPQGLTARHGDTVLDLVTEPPVSDQLLDKIRSLAGVATADLQDGHLRVTLEGARSAAGDVVTTVADQVRIRDVNQRHATLDDVFLRLTGREMRD
jgi:daunorubicin resistance ABC transporter ATP-binding subunit